MPRRIVTGVTEDGRHMILSDGEPPRSMNSLVVADSSSALIWATGASPTPGPDPTPAVESLVPRSGETTALVVRFPPDSVYSDPGLDHEAAAAEQLVMSPGLVELFETEDPAMHTTPTVDYAVVIDGEIVLDLGGSSTVVRQGDIVVQNASRHAWRNPGTKPASVFFVLIGASAQ
jgi:quercetin dioxygenase-like cupin family protein